MQANQETQIAARQYLWSLAAGIVIGVLVLVTSSVPGSPTGFLWAPGFFGAALVFHEGVHSDSPMGWFVLACVLDVLLYSGVVLGIWLLIARSREKHLRRTEESGR
jgi:hypothetical protein